MVIAVNKRLFEGHLKDILCKCNSCNNQIFDIFYILCYIDLQANSPDGVWLLLGTPMRFYFIMCFDRY